MKTNPLNLLSVRMSRLCAALTWMLLLGTVPAVRAQTVQLTPASPSITVGGSVTFTANTTGTVFIYTWFKNGAVVNGQTSSTLVINNAQVSDSGTYVVQVAGTGLGVNSNAAILTVSPPIPTTPSRLTNLSVRTTAGTGAQTLIVGFTIIGTGSKQVLFRSIGPSLTQFGVTGVLGDPRIALATASGSQFATNDNWGGTAALSSAFSSVGAFPLAPGSLDAALTTTYSAGVGTALTSGPTGATGVVLVEAYDLDAVTASTRFVNLSVRSVAGTGAQTLIVGFALAGGANRNVLIRAIGPSLAQFGVTGVLANPTLSILAGNTTIRINDDWGSDPSLANTFASVSAFPLASNTQDSALQVSLPPGVYSAVVTGVNNTTGVALVELYELP